MILSRRCLKINPVLRIMSQVNLKINDRDYLVACEDGEEKHLAFLAQHINQQVKGLVESVGQVGEARLLLMVALMIADELTETNEELKSLKEGNIKVANGDGDQLDQICQRIEDIALQLETTYIEL